MRLAQIFFTFLTVISVISQADDRHAVPARLQKTQSVSILENFTIGIPGTQSFRLSWLENESEKCRQFLAMAKFEAQQKLKSVQQQNAVDYILANAKVSETISEFSLPASKTVKLKDPGYDNVQFVAIYNEEKAIETLILSGSYFFPNLAAFKRLTPSPDKKKLLITVGLNGSTDNYQVVAYDLESKKIFHQFEINGTVPQWKDNDTVSYTSPFVSSSGYAEETLNLTTLEKTTYTNATYFDIGDWHGLIGIGDGHSKLTHAQSNEVLVYDFDITDYSPIGENDEYFFIQPSGKEGGDKVLRLAKKSHAQPETVISRQNEYIRSVTMAQDSLFVIYTSNGRDHLQVTDLKEFKNLYDQIMPDCCTLEGAEWKEETKENLVLTFSSYVQDYVEFPVSRNEAPSEELLNEMMNSSEGLKVTTKVIYIKSFDETLIPVRIAYRRDLVLDGQRPVYMETYGGFYNEGYMSPTRNHRVNDFMKKGGIYVAPGVRGGSENGYEWYASAIKKNKIVTLKDLIAVARGLVDLGYTQNNKIISFGASNGGFVVAAAARLAPDAFGLVIPMNGVHDQLKYHYMDRWGFGWADDYGDPNSNKYVKPALERSALEVKKVKTERECEYLIMSGEDDSRVNKVHSYKLKAILDEQSPGKAILFSVDQAGHNAISISGSRAAGIQAAAVMWSKIYDFSGLNFKD